MARLYFQGTSDSVRKGVTMRGHKYIDTQFLFGDQYNPNVIIVRLNEPAGEDSPILWINTQGVRDKIKIVVNEQQVV